MILCLWSPLHPSSKFLAIQNHTQNLEEQLWMGGRREVSIISHRPVTRSDLKQERSFFRGSVSTFLQLVVANPLKRVKWCSSVFWPCYSETLTLRPPWLYDRVVVTTTLETLRSRFGQLSANGKLRLAVRVAVSRQRSAMAWQPRWYPVAAMFVFVNFNWEIVLKITFFKKRIR